MVGNIRYAAELHLVHEAEDHRAAVIAILYQYGNSPAEFDPFLAKVYLYTYYIINCGFVYVYTKINEDVHIIYIYNYSWDRHSKSCLRRSPIRNT